MTVCVCVLNIQITVVFEIKGEFSQHMVKQVDTTELLPT